MGKLKEIRKDFAELKANSELLKEKVIELEQLKETFQEIATKFNAMYDNYFLPEQEISEAEIKQQQEEVANQMKMVVRGAISDMLADPENQKAIQTFAQQFSASMTGQAGGLPFDLDGISDKDGNIDPIKAVFMWFANKQKGDAFKGIAPTSGKTTGY